MEGESPDQARLRWDERHRAGDFEGHGPNPAVVDAVAGLEPGRALELASGSGTNAVWLARRGWQVTAVDWSPVGLANGRGQADAAGVKVEWLERDLFEWAPDAAAFDLVLIAYLHLPPARRRDVYAAAARAVAVGGRLVVVGHDRINLTEGQGGPPDQERLFTAEELAAELTAGDRMLEVERAEVVRHRPAPQRAPIDSLLVLRRR